MKWKRHNFVVISAELIAVVTAVWVLWPSESQPQRDIPAIPSQPVLSVVVISPQQTTLPVSIAASGNIMAWQEASIGTEANGLRLADVLVNVGDIVRQDQLLATFASDTLKAELAQSQASVAEAKAALAEARANAKRARDLQTSGALSGQQIQQYITAEHTAQARLQLAEASEQSKQLQLSHTRVQAPDDGIISARSATVGAVLPVGEELFRLIRQGRLEWRAEVTASELEKLAPGQAAHVTPVGGETLRGRLRMVGPVVDTQTRNGLVYVDLPDLPAGGSAARPGMFARGDFRLDSVQALTLPQSAVLLRDGFSYVFCVSPDSRVEQIKVTTGRRTGDRIEILSGIDAAARVVASGAGFLGDGDLVRVVEQPHTRHGGAE